MKAAILTIGDELLIGQIVNTNSAWIAQELTTAGVHVTVQSTVGDSPQAITEELDRLRSTVDWMILTGGLGPTHDDVTKTVLTAYTADELQLHEETLEHLRTLLQRRGRDLTPRNAEQAMLPSRCIPLRNDSGTAPGMLFELGDVHMVSLPGVPDEMKHLMQTAVLPRIHAGMEASPQDRWEYRTLHTTGIVESQLADLLGPIEAIATNGSLAFLPNYQGVRLRVGKHGANPVARREELAAAVAYIMERAGRYIYGEAPTSLASAVVRQLADRAETVSVAESCTGGSLGAAFTDVPGSSAVFMGGVIAYDNRVKVRMLDVPQETIDTHGAVSREVAEAMAIGARARLDTTYGIGITGIAGPGGGTPEKPVGTVWIAFATSAGTVARLAHLGEVRHVIRERAVGYALNMLWKRLAGHDDE